MLEATSPTSFTDDWLNRMLPGSNFVALLRAAGVVDVPQASTDREAVTSGASLIRVELAADVPNA